MEKVGFEEFASDMVKQLESTLGKLSLSAESGLSTYTLEDSAKKLASKIKALSEIFKDCSVYKDIKKNTVYHPERDIPDHLFTRYAKLCKDCKDPLSLYKDEDSYFAEIADNLFISISELPSAPFPEFKVKLEGNTIIAVRADLYEKLTSETKKLISAPKE